MKRITKLLASLLLVLSICFSLGSCSELFGAFLPGEGAETPQTPTNTDGELAVHFLDVGQADSILVVDGDMVMMIDTGDWPSGDHKTYMLNYIRDLGITEIDYLVLTHPDADHIGGAPEVINTFTVKNCIMPNETKTTQVFKRTLDALEDREVNVLLPTPGDTYTLKNATFRILAPLKEDYNDTNDHSVVLRLMYGERSILFTGDAEAYSEEDMVATYTAADLKSDVLKVGHHGSVTSSSPAFLALVDPDYAVISCGVGNSYGHPHDETVERLQNAGIQMYRTDTQGTIILKTDGKTLSFATLGNKTAAD